MKPRIRLLAEKKLIGKKLNMSLADNKTVALWKDFMPRRNEIENKIGTDFYSIQVYNEPLKPGDLHQSFEKWAAIEVTSVDIIPAGMETFTLQKGMYAVFFYKGLNTDISIFKYIFDEWLPNSEYELDQRPQFEILGEKYKNNDVSSEEEIWIPIKKK